MSPPLPHPSSVPSVLAAFGLAGWAVALWIERRQEARTAAAAAYVTLPQQRPPVADLCEQQRR